MRGATTLGCGLCRDHILKTCELCGADLEHGHKLIHLCEPCKNLMRERRSATMRSSKRGDSA